MNRKICLKVIGLTYLFYSFLLAKEFEVNPSITKVTVYFNHALIERHGEIVLPEGYHHVVLTPLEPKILSQSIQIKGTGNAVILDISTRSQYIDFTASEPYRLYQDSLKYFQSQEKLIQAQISNLNEEKEVLKANQSIKGENNNVTAQELLNVLNLYRSRLDEITRKTIQLEKEKEKIREEIKRIKLILNELRGRKSKTISQIVLEVWCKKSGKVSLDISYLVSDARWKPEYLVRVTEAGKPIQLELYALVSQWTDQTWDRIPISISTATPTENLTIPTLMPWWLSIYTPIHFEKSAPSRTRTLSTRDEFGGDYGGVDAFGFDEEKEEPAPPPEPEIETTENYTQLSTRTLNLQFHVKIPYSISSGSKPYKVFLTTYEIPAKYQYLTIPKKDQSVFLTAVLNKWDIYYLIPANARLFFEDQYTGSFYLNPNIAEDSLLISLGKDPNISVNYELLTQYTKVKTVGNYKKETRTYQIKIRNNKSIPVTLTVHDQIPLSTTSEIDVIPIELNGGIVNKDDGKISWNFTLAPNETKTIQWTIEVKYPKDKLLQNW